MGRRSTFRGGEGGRLAAAAELEGAWCRDCSCVSDAGVKMTARFQFFSQFLFEMAQIGSKVYIKRGNPSLQNS